jgi:dTDP-4-dehydrorhamnose 3,5-epimerase
MIETTALDGVLIVTPQRFGDERGWFSETWNRNSFARHGIDIDFVQDNHSLSRDVGTVRGLHCQAPPHAQDKLVRAVRGAILDVAVDARVGSPTYGNWISVELSAQNGRQLFVPKGFLHGFSTLTPDTEVIYKCSDFYDRASEMAVRFDDAELGIDWGADTTSAVLSDKDRIAPAFRDFTSPFVFEAA